VQVNVGSASNIFLENNISGATWINNTGDNNIFNNSAVGNIYYFTNGTPSWEIYNIIDTNGDLWADAGSNWHQATGLAEGLIITHTLLTMGAPT